MLQAGIRELSGIEKVYITVERENKVGKTFYEAKGFKAIKEFDEDFDGHILKSIRMVLNLEE